MGQEDDYVVNDTTTTSDGVGIGNRMKGSKDRLGPSRIIVYNLHLQRITVQEAISFLRSEEHAGCDKGLMRSPYFRFLKYKKQIMSEDLI